jgi:hypothetical protein
MWDRSTGPITKQGKRTVSHNAVKHGLRDRTMMARMRQVGQIASMQRQLTAMLNAASG